jgi:hypothetical protein
MNQDIKEAYLVITIFALLVLAGFYGVMTSVNDVRTDVKNIELQLAVSANVPQKLEPVPQQIPTPQPEPPTPAPQQVEQMPAIDGSITIPTTITFTANSSPRLQPLVSITVSVDSVKKTTDGRIAVTITALASSAGGYSALEVPRHFEIIDFETGSEHPSEVKGNFDSIPPKTRVSGTVLFAPQEKRGNIILQVGVGDTAKFYEFDFVKKTYRETIVG